MEEANESTCNSNLLTRFKSKRVLTKKQMSRFKWMIGLLAIWLSLNIVMAQDSVNVEKWKDYDSLDEMVKKRGQIVEYSDDDSFCRSWMIPEGFSLINKFVLGGIYFAILCYLFLGIAIIADIFMG